MGYALILILAWFGFAVIALAVLHRRALAAVWREPVLARPVLIVESDDWGPGPEEDAAALREIAATLGAVRDRGGRSAVMTLGVVGGVPDAAAIRASGFSLYARRSLLEPDFAPIVAAMCDGCRAGVFALQRHGLEHFWPASLMARLRVADGCNSEGILRWLDEGGLRSEALPSPLQSRWVDCTCLPSAPLDPVAVAQAVHEETDLLQRVFGGAPEVAVPNTFVWDDGVEQAWAAHGVRVVVTPGWRYEGRDAAGRLLPPARRIRNGEIGRGGVTYVVRDAYFEPVRGHRAEDVTAALARKCGEGRPLLLETHRESFIGPPPARVAAVAELGRALRMAQSVRPDLCFTTTAELAQALRDAASPLRERRWTPRLAAWCARVCNEPGVARLLKYSGLGALLGAARYLLGDVTYRRSPDAGRC
ncbi:hypothetical protein GPA27_04990 [Aromatoleum toluolicum]|uniref:hypothetical protein n=1 Tax=Aromatoleum toluolicum TaxID=90060 RepID=UPI001B7D0298|nr:hypothetical protein [Aromatoleum toluolicum]MCQ6963971.1 hypothetical protein [Aromatoleum toluolicum]